MPSHVICVGGACIAHAQCSTARMTVERGTRKSVHDRSKLLVVYWLGLKVRVRARARAKKWILFLPFFFSALKSDEHLSAKAVYVRRNAAFTLHLGHVTGDMKRRESNVPTESQVPMFRIDGYSVSSCSQYT